MTSFEEMGKMMLRNRLLGRWAAVKLGKSDKDAKDYVDAVVSEANRDGDVFGRVRKDFDAAGVAQSDEDIARAITEFTIVAGNQLSTAGGGLSDAAAVALKRNLTR